MDFLPALYVAARTAGKNILHDREVSVIFLHLAAPRLATPLSHARSHHCSTFSSPLPRPEGNSQTHCLTHQLTAREKLGG